ncbi:MBL fold metallo-hydrolase [Chloroflexota bacterium]
MNLKIHHLNCGTIRMYGGVGLFGTGGLLTPAHGVIHCLLIETEEGLLLVDTGPGINDCTAPTPFIKMMLALGGSRFDLQETAYYQVEKLGYQPSDVKHIALTHFHYDHAGGLPDFPDAKIHIFDEEYKGVIQPRDFAERTTYRPEHHAHGPDWQVHKLVGDHWFGFESTPAIDLGNLKFHFIPLPRHTAGHCGIALKLGDGWLLHCGDAYLYHGEIDIDSPSLPPYHWLFGTFFKVTKPFRAIGAHTEKLRELRRGHGHEIQFTCSHDPVEFEKFIWRLK